MHKFINGKYHKVDHVKNDTSAQAAHKDAPAGTATADDPVVNAASISAAAVKIMKDRADIDWTGMTGTGKGGQVTKKDAQAFLAKVTAGAGAAAE